MNHTQQDANLSFNVKLLFLWLRRQGTNQSVNCSALASERVQFDVQLNQACMNVSVNDANDIYFI
jgi:hypothetical protein